MELWAIIPELILGGLCLCLVPIAGFARGRWRQLPIIIAIAGFMAAIAYTARMLPWEPFAVFEGTYAVDGFAHVFKLLLELGAVISLFLIKVYFRDHSQVVHAPVMVVFATLGGLGVVSSMDLGLIVLFLQMLSLASYLLVGMIRSDRHANEAMIKYFIYAATALAIMAYGLTFLYGLTGSLELTSIGAALQGAHGVWIAVALGLILVGYGFEIAMIPFHFWAPDVYQGATAPITGFLSVVPKIAGFAGFLRFALLALPAGLANWPLIVTIIAVGTMAFGNLVALGQTRLKRLLAYSSIAQAGYVLMAMAVAHQVDSALPAVGYYLAAYLFMNLGAFSVVAQLERTFGTDHRSMLRGLSRQAPGSAAVLALALLSLAGIPPLAGFAGKVVLIKSTLEGGLTWLAILAATNMALALFYYVRIIAAMYLEDVVSVNRLAGGGTYKGVLVATTIGTVLLGVFPNVGLRLMHTITNLAF